MQLVDISYWLHPATIKECEVDKFARDSIYASHFRCSVYNAIMMFPNTSLTVWQAFVSTMSVVTNSELYRTFCQIWLANGTLPCSHEHPALGLFRKFPCSSRPSSSLHPVASLSRRY